ncbi:unnamed protein product [Rotaria sp. Silwood1]|nr:unnamed protein product [Rotaria sp. Silwood1]
MAHLWLLSHIVFFIIATTISTNIGLRTQKGIIYGRQTQHTIEYLGSQYAKIIRWKSPIDLASELFPNSSFHATSFGPCCPQATSPIYIHKQDEQCLYLNIYKPIVSSNHSLLPVFVWIHGGGHRRGCSSQSVDCNLSHFDSYNFKFISPIKLAAETSVYKYGSLRLLYKNRNSPTKMQIEKHLAFYFNSYDSSNNEKNDLFFEFTISRLLHTRISQYTSEEMDVINVALWNYDKVLLHGRKLNIGLTYNKFLKVRIYTLFQWLAKMRADTSSTHNSTEYAIIENELLHHLEAYYLLYDIQHIPIEFTKDMMQSKLNKEKSFRLLVLECYRDIAENIIRKIKELQPKEEYIIPTGWDGHAVCITFRRIDQTRISIRVDNPSRLNPPNMHETELIASNVHRIRSKMLGLLDIANLDKNINYFMLLVDSIKQN